MCRHLLRSFILFIFICFGACCLAQAPTPSALGPRLDDVEYNLGSCAGDAFAEIHLVVATNAKGEQTFVSTYSSGDEPGEFVKEEKPPVFSVTLTSPKLVNGDVIFRAHITDYTNGGGKIIRLDLNGRINGDKIIAILLVDGELGHIMYGRKGAVDDMIKIEQEDYLTCVAFSHFPISELPDVLIRWLHAK